MKNKTWTTENIKARESLLFSLCTAFSFGFNALNIWGKCKIDPTNSIELTTKLARNSRLDEMDLIISSRLSISSEQEKTLINEFNTINKKTEISDLLFDAGLLPSAFRVVKDNSNPTTLDKWFGLPNYIDQFQTLDFESLTVGLSNKNINQGLTLAIGNQLFYIYKTAPIFAILALILDYYADKNIPENQNEPSSEITKSGTALMTEILINNLNTPDIKANDINFMFDALKNKNLLPRVAHKFNTELIDKLKIQALKSNFENFLKLENTDEPTDKQELIIHEKKIPDHYELHKDNLITLSTLFKNDLKLSQALSVIKASELIIPNCTLEFKNRFDTLKLTLEDILYAFIEEEELYIVLNKNRGMYSSSILLSLEETIENHLDIFERTTICYENQCKVPPNVQKQINLINAKPTNA